MFEYSDWQLRCRRAGYGLVRIEAGLKSTFRRPVRIISQAAVKRAEPTDKQQAATAVGRRSKGGVARTAIVTPSCLKYRQAPGYHCCKSLPARHGLLILQCLSSHSLVDK